MKAILIIIGYYIGIITMCLFINNKQIKREQEISNYYINKSKIYTLLYNLDIEQKTIKQTTAKYRQIEYAKEQLEKLLN